MRLLLAALIGVGCVAAQHNTIYEDARVRILDLKTEPRGSVLPHRHATDYVWVADSEIHFSRADSNHVERNGEIVIELLQRQTDPKNVCGEVLSGEYLHCHEPGAEWLGANLQIQFETDQTHIGILQIAPNATLALPPADVPPLLIALEGAEAEAVTRANGASTASGVRRTLTAANVLRSPADQITEIRNTGKAVARFLVVEFGGPGE
jgi:hypothetical protein